MPAKKLRSGSSLDRNEPFRDFTPPTKQQRTLIIPMTLPQNSKINNATTQRVRQLSHGVETSTKQQSAINAKSMQKGVLLDYGVCWTNDKETKKNLMKTKENSNVEKVNGSLLSLCNAMGIEPIRLDSEGIAFVGQETGYWRGQLADQARQIPCELIKNKASVHIQLGWRTRNIEL
jgi:hypothetical protein